MRGFMRYVMFVLVVPLCFWAIDTTQIVAWIEAPTVTVVDAVWLVESLSDPGLERDKIAWQKYGELKREERLTAGKLAKILVIAGKVKPGLFYRFTGWQRYALMAVQAEGLLSAEYVVGRPITGAELVAVASKLE